MARVLNTSNIKSTYFGGGRIYSVVSDQKLENGMIGVVGKLKDGGKELREITKVTDLTTAVELVLVGNPEVMYDERPSMRRLENFEIPAGTSARAYSLAVGDEFEVSLDAINCVADNTPKKDNYVVLKANTFEFDEKANLDGNEQFVTRVEELTNMNRPLQLDANNLSTVTKMARLKVIKYNNQ